MDVESELGDPAILGMPIPVRSGATQEWVERIDRGLPQRGPIALRTDDEA